MYSPGPAIYHFQQVEAEGAVFWLPLLLFIGICESYRVGLGWAEPRSERFYSLRDDYEPGNLGFDPFGLLPEDPKERYELQVGEGIYSTGYYSCSYRNQFIQKAKMGAAQAVVVFSYSMGS